MGYSDAAAAVDARRELRGQLGGARTRRRWRIHTAAAHTGVGAGLRRLAAVRCSFWLRFLVRVINGISRMSRHASFERIMRKIGGSKAW